MMESDKMSTASSVGAERRPLLNALVIERRILFACTVFVGLSAFLWITAVCTHKWVHINSAKDDGRRGGLKGQVPQSEIERWWEGECTIAMGVLKSKKSVNSRGHDPTHWALRAAIFTDNRLKRFFKTLTLIFGTILPHTKLRFLSSESGMWEICRDLITFTGNNTETKQDTGTISIAARVLIYGRYRSAIYIVTRAAPGGASFVFKPSRVPGIPGVLSRAPAASCFHSLVRAINIGRFSLARLLFLLNSNKDGRPVRVAPQLGRRGNLL
ncbi:hypothetical protein EVAR_59327_1 [Eumeta japonica]|uniref:Uncharacterized protein n=1 Tax=Eumeta variegata TaxID=151549 RepID=A0A4C1YRS7_EUMVA|nr:hypothetical protein EVAR_59327_1 [Eumeta japonica]